MKTIKNQIKGFSLFLSILVVFQSCTVYKSKPVTLEQAAKKEIKTKVETNNGVKIKFKHIGFEDGSYYGLKKNKDRMALNEKHINNIKIKDKALSTIVTIVLPVAIIVGVGALIFKDGFVWKDDTTIDLSR